MVIIDKGTILCLYFERERRNGTQLKKEVKLFKSFKELDAYVLQYFTQRRMRVKKALIFRAKITEVKNVEITKVKGVIK